MLRILLVSILVGLIAPVAVTAAADEAPDWPQYRGPNRDGISAETGLARTWPDAGPQELWRRPIGPAFSSFAAVDRHLYTTESDAEGEYVLKLDPITGENAWRQKIAGTFENNFGNGPRATPTLDGDRLFVVSGSGGLHALRSSDGEALWSVDFKETFGVEQMYFGFSTSPLVLGDRLIVDVGATEGRAMVAFDKATGKVLWQAGEGGAAYGSPILVEVAGEPQLVLANRAGVLGVSPDGKALWSHPWAEGEGVKPSMPIFVEPDRLFVSASYDIGALGLRLGAEGKVEKVWQNKVMRNHFNSSVQVDGMVYGFDNATLKCVDPKTGEQTWAKRGGLGKGSLVYADGLLVLLTETGTLKLVEAKPDAYSEIASAKVLSGRCWTSPTLWDGKVFLRNREEAVAFDLKASGPGGSDPKAAPAASEESRR
ncbi:MAG: PQQ-binding-like beta-propeller repeat protein [Acidobacteriota bacterium]